MLAQYYSLSGSVEYYIILYMKWIMNTINLCEEGSQCLRCINLEYVYSGIYIKYKCIRGNNMIEQSVWSNAIYTERSIYYTSDV